MICHKRLKLSKRYEAIRALFAKAALTLFHGSNAHSLEHHQNSQKLTTDRVSTCQSHSLTEVEEAIISPNDSTASTEEISWVECDDVYKPIEEEFRVFTQKRFLHPQFCSVYISEVAIASLLCHLKSNTYVEQGGILFGNAYSDPERGIYLEVIDAIAAPETIASETHLQFTAHSWQGIMARAKELDPGNQIVGWYHSHPDLGVFMSSVDMRTHQAFFSNPWCLSIVCDPVRKEIGYFQGLEASKVRPILFSTWLRG